jgi:hypothetical protein
VNLVSNLGFRPDASHTKAQSWVAELPTGEMGDLRHPPFVQRNAVADAATYASLFKARRRDVLKAKLRAAAGAVRRKVRSLASRPAPVRGEPVSRGST